jgi:hypothetical protein
VKHIIGMTVGTPALKRGGKKRTYNLLTTAEGRQSTYRVETRIFDALGHLVIETSDFTLVSQADLSCRVYASKPNCTLGETEICGRN